MKSPFRRGTDGQSLPVLFLGATLLLWPALLNGYPLVFSDTGTYLSQALNRYLGWDRPVFYSLFLLPLHMGLTTWPAVAAQALIAAWVLRLSWQVLLPQRPSWWVGALALLSAVSSLPWVAAQLMPDLFTPLLVLALGLLVLVPERLGSNTLGLALLAGFAIAAHLSNLPLAIGTILILLPLRRRLGARVPLLPMQRTRILGIPAIAAAALMSVNLAGHGSASLAPFGSVFLLARVIEDGPGRDALARFCPASGWRLCAERGRLGESADDFLWRSDSALNAVGGPKRLGAEAGSIVAAAIRAEPGAELRAAAGNTLRQFASFESGDGLRAWPDTVTPWMRRDFPRFELLAYTASRQSAGRELLPRWLGALHVGVAVAGVIASLCVLPGVLRRRDPLGGIIVAVVAALLINAAVTGALSGPHARYQSRLMWLPVLTMLLASAARVSRPA